MVTKKTTKKVPTTSDAGGYSAEKGGYVDAMGNLYPTNEPKFVPGATGLPNTNISFNKDNTVTVNGETMTSERYKQMQKNKGYYDLVEKQQQQQQQQQIQENVNAKRTAELQAAFAGEQPATEGAPATEATPWEERTPVQKITSLLTGSAMQEAAQAQGGELITGAPIITGAGAASLIPSAAATTAKVVSKAGEAFSAVKAFSFAGVATTAYGIFTKTKANGLTGDIKTLVKTNALLAAQVKAGADPIAIKSLMDANRQAIIDKAADLRLAKKISLVDRIAGLDAEEDIQNALVKIAGTNAIVDEYILTGNPAVLDKLGAYNVEE